ncbi:putative flavin carrier protein 3 [Dimargaris cristalligena]|nr:putative flavin carrier protein 3 [Dimargaris cristalligena]
MRGSVNTRVLIPNSRTFRQLCLLALLLSCLARSAQGLLRRATNSSSAVNLRINNFQNCNSDSPVQFSIPIVNYIEDTNQFDLQLSVNNRDPITGGETIIVLEVLGNTVGHETTPSCDMASTSCPIEEGDQLLEKTIDVPGDIVSVAKKVLSVPGVSVDGRVTIQDESGTEIGCLQFSMESESSLYRAPVAITVGVAVGLAGLVTFLANVFQSSSAAPLESTAANAAAVALPVGGVALGLSAIAKANVFSGPTPNVLDIMSFAQFVTTTGALSLNYPPVYQQFIANFGWSVGIVRLPFLESLYDRLQPLSAQNATVLVRRAVGDDPLQIGLGGSNNSTILQLDPDAIGIQRYAALVGVPPQHIFINMFAVFVILLLIALVFCLLVRFIIFAVVRFRPFRFMAMRRYFFHWTSGVILRIFVMAYLPLAAVSFLEITLGPQQPGQQAFAYIFLVGLCFLLIAVLSFIVIRTGPRTLYTNDRYLYSYGPLYVHYVVNNYAFFVALFAYKIVQASILGTAGKAVIAQVAILAANELIYLLLMLIRSPFVRKLDRNLNITIGVLRLVNTALLVTFIVHVNASTLVRLIIAVVCMVLQVVVLACYIILVVYTAFQGISDFILNKNIKPVFEEDRSTNLEAATNGPGGADGSTNTFSITRDRSVIRDANAAAALAASKKGRFRAQLARGNTLLSRLTGTSSTVGAHRSNRSGRSSVASPVGSNVIYLPISNPVALSPSEHPTMSSTGDDTPSETPAHNAHYYQGLPRPPVPTPSSGLDHHRRSDFSDSEPSTISGAGLRSSLLMGPRGSQSDMPMTRSSVVDSSHDPDNQHPPLHQQYPPALPCNSSTSIRETPLAGGLLPYPTAPRESFTTFAVTSLSSSDPQLSDQSMEYPPSPPVVEVSPAAISREAHGTTGFAQADDEIFTRKKQRGGYRL